MRRLTLPTAVLLVLSACSRSEDCGPYVFDPVHRFCICGDGGTFNPDAEMCEWPVDAQVIETDAPDAAVEPDAPIDGGCEGLLGTREHCSACGDRCAWRCESAELGCDDPATVAISDQHVCLATTLGNVYCWGATGSGQLGTGDGEVVLEPSRVVGITGAVGVTTGRITTVLNTCAWTAAGALFCWGGNLFGQVGDGTTEPRYSPTAVSGMSSMVTAASTDGGRTCAVRDGGVFCWGLGAERVPARIPLTGRATSVVTSMTHSCAIVEETLWCWGDNSSGQLGDGTDTSSDAPIRVPLDGRVTAVALGGGGHTCAIVAERLHCWGRNDEGQVGVGTAGGAEHSPLSITLDADALDVMAESVATCAITVDGALYCWGANEYGRVGDGTTMRRTRPARVPSFSAARVSTIGTRTCAIARDGRPWCWGADMLGDGTAGGRAAPVPVLAP